MYNVSYKTFLFKSHQQTNKQKKMKSKENDAKQTHHIIIIEIGTITLKKRDE